MHQTNYHLLGIKWRGNTYIDRTLPFGLRSVLIRFIMLSLTFIAWVLFCQGVKFRLHYLDDFLLLGTPNSQQGREFLTIAMQTLTCIRRDLESLLGQ